MEDDHSAVGVDKSIPTHSMWYTGTNGTMEHQLPHGVPWLNIVFWRINLTSIDTCGWFSCCCWSVQRNTEMLSVLRTIPHKEFTTRSYVFVRTVEDLTAVLVSDQILLLLDTRTIDKSHPVTLLNVCSVHIIQHFPILHYLERKRKSKIRVQLQNYANR